ncbi:DoxX family protein [Agarivorans sp. 1_MG-2023]|uniref:DoxX family protein n=1 Tax=Agarivorans sp. 1_MG-2023 TaxID=3062634 RepID=UPI0026E115EB|nr:DoxX family protein [Agarivorans sp. 1_MG-2023]MDO6765588.1 DoxX family protein [Agarivorans sp. 1_MG-2023]
MQYLLNYVKKGMMMEQKQFDTAALWLRLGLGLVFIIGGTSKLSLLLDPTSQAAMVANYMGTTGYINELFQDYLFSAGWLTPWSFLTALSAFELFSGLALCAGFLVRPLALFYAFLLWTFVVSLPVDTVPGASVGVSTYTSPAIFVQIRDITLSGMMFVLFNLGSGLYSVDKRLSSQEHHIDWQTLGLLLRFSLGMTFIVAGFFAGYAKIPSFATHQVILLTLGLVLIFAQGKTLKVGALLCALVMLWFMLQKFSIDKSFIKNLNGFKREFALLAAGAVIALLGGGERFSLADLAQRAKSYYLFRRATSK